VKTISLKKVSAVAVASLGFGLLSVVPAYAAAESVTAVNVKAATANDNTQNSEQSIFVGASATGTDIDTNDTVDFKATLTTSPAGGFVTVVGQTGEATLVFAGDTGADTGSSGVATYTAGANATGGAATISATGTDGLVKFSFTPTKPGTHVVLVWNDQDLDGVMDVTEARTDISFTIAAQSGLSTTLSTVRMAGAAQAANLTNNLTDANYTSTANSVTRAGYKTSGTEIAEIQVILVDSDGTTASAGHTISCQVTGSGFCEVGDTVAEDATTGVTLRSDSLALAGNVGYVSIVADGTAGTGTVEIKVTDAVTEAVTSLGTRSFYTFGDVTKLEVTQIMKIGKAAGGNVGYSGATRSASNIPATVVLATDALGQAANITASGVPTLVPTDVTVSSGGTCVKDDGSSTTYSSGKGYGYYNCDLATPSSAVSGKTTATIARIVSPADATLYIKSAEFTTTVGGSISSAKETLSFDKTSYAPGEAMIVTRTAVDSSGNPVWDGSTSPAITFSKAIGGSGGGAGTYLAGKSATSTTIAGATVFAPVVPGAFTAIMTGGATGAATNGITASATVTDANAGLLTQIDALNAKIVALNALIAKIMKKLGVK